MSAIQHAALQAACQHFSIVVSPGSPSLLGQDEASSKAELPTDAKRRAEMLTSGARRARRADMLTSEGEA
jgi:hypothetical protein